MEATCDSCDDLAVGICEDCRAWLCGPHIETHLCPELEDDSMRAFAPDGRETATYRLGGLVDALRLDVPTGFGAKPHTPAELWTALGAVIAPGA